MEINLNQPGLIKNNEEYRRSTFLNDDQLNIVKESFDLFDSDKSGIIDLYELKLTLKAFNFKISKEKFQSLTLKYKCTNNTIRYDDFIDLMTELFSERSPKEEASMAFEAFDEEKKGKIGIKQLKKAVEELNTNIEEEDLKAIIKEFDADEDGYITKEDFLKILDEYYFN
jgi:centrin-3